MADQYVFVLEPLKDSVDFSLYQEESSTKSQFDALYQAVESILRIPRGSEFFDSNIGSFLEETLFKKIDQQLASILELRIEDLITTQDSRIEQATIKIDLDPDQVSIYLNVTLISKDYGVGPTKRYQLVSNET